MPTPPVSVSPEDETNKFLKENRVAVFSKSYCPFCEQVKDLLRTHRIPYSALELDLIDNGPAVQTILFERTGQKSVPNVFINGRHLGGCDKTVEAHADGTLQAMLNAGSGDAQYDYDLAVIGGGSGGLACSKEAARLGARVVICDFVKPSPKGTTWGLGGTCVNVGCIPKKLMHQTSLLGEACSDASKFGWSVTESPQHSWEKMVKGIQGHISSLNWGYRVQLRERHVTYMNAYAEFVDAHTLRTVDKKGRERLISARNVVLAMGGRPRIPDIPGAELGISSDDLFSLPRSPGRTLVVGASYIALECAGFLRGLGLPVTVMVRSILLRGFDQQMAELVGEHLAQRGVRFLRPCVPTRLERVEPDEEEEADAAETRPSIRVTAQMEDGTTLVAEYDTVLFATGRRACTAGIGLEKIGVRLSPKDGKVMCNEAEQTSVEHVYAVGDILSGHPELTPVAIQAGRQLARRLVTGATALTDYQYIPTTVFTPAEYGCVGLSEEAAVERYGEHDIEVFHQYFTPLELTVPQRDENASYGKLICVKSQRQRVVGFHLVAPHAGEVTQGFAVALRLGATKADLDASVGIHPTVAEQFTFMFITKASGANSKSTGC
ncbi:thioredoxin reductase 1, cytoplasmic-like [Amphibalanus amphitrite]|uniref:thioredoxin reductase 1, cytoplasmic-like n=1 Tax=Amphibalanus amphitrite TaxID=1232801 RepID=UPI001C90147A|nr:thioredoxin reductase 1, cytoplasmic-like [Amphibalanus amphitrite]